MSAKVTRPTYMAPKTAKKRRSRGVTGVQLGEDVVHTRILTGAAQVFTEMGVRATSVEDILQAAKVSRRTFYRLYADKESVMAALYRIGTERLIDACKVAVTEEGVARQIAGCIDAHLRTAREQPRLVFILGGEAQHSESRLYARRMEVHGILTDLLLSAAEAHARQHLDPLLVRALVIALEGITRVVLTESDQGRSVTDGNIDRARHVMMRISVATLNAKGAGIPPLPVLE